MIVSARFVLSGPGFGYHRRVSSSADSNDSFDFAVRLRRSAVRLDHAAQIVDLDELFCGRI